MQFIYNFELFLCCDYVKESHINIVVELICVLVFRENNDFWI